MQILINRYLSTMQNSNNNKYNFCNCKIAVFQIKNKKGRYLQGMYSFGLI